MFFGSMLQQPSGSGAPTHHFFSDPHAVCHGAIKFFMEIKLAYMIGKFLQGRPSSSSRSYYDARSVCGIVNLVVLVMRRLSVRLVYCIETDKD